MYNEPWQNFLRDQFSNYSGQNSSEYPDYSGSGYTGYSQNNGFLGNQDPVSVKDWLITMLFMGIPVVNIVLLIYWVVGKNTKPSLSNYCRAALIMAAVVLVLSIVFGAVIAGTLANMSRNSY